MAVLKPQDPNVQKNKFQTESENAISRLKSSGYNDQQIGNLLGTASAEEISAVAGGKNLPNMYERLVGTSDPVSSTDEIRDDITEVKSLATKGIDDIFEGGSLTDSILKMYDDVDVGQEGGKIAQADSELDQLAKNLGIFSSQEERSIAESGEAAYGEFAPDIAEAEEAKRRGLPKAIIGGGERGGFMSTQFAGGAALQTTEGGDFMGEGGVLNQIKSDYDRNISLVKGQAKQARLMAMAAARQAIRTGKREDYQMMERARERMRQTSRDLITLNQAKADTIYQYADFQRENVKFKNLLDDRERAIREGDEDRATAAEDKARKIAVDRLNNIMDSLGPEGIENNREEIENLFNQIGFEGIDFDDVLNKIIEDAEAARIAGLPKPELRNDPNGNLISLTYNPETGEYDTKTLIKKAVKASGGSGGGSKKDEPEHTLTRTQENALLRAFTKKDIPIIQETVEELGLPAVLSDPDLTFEQKNAIRKAWGQKEEVTEDLVAEDELSKKGWTQKQIKAYKDYVAKRKISIIPEEFEKIMSDLF